MAPPQRVRSANPLAMKAADVIHRGFGPSIDGLFFQSNLGEHTLYESLDGKNRVQILTFQARGGYQNWYALVPSTRGFHDLRGERKEPRRSRSLDGYSIGPLP
jgi:hypothetical protein